MQQSSQGAAMAQTAMVAYPMGAVVADSLINYQINTVSLRTGNNEYEQRLQFGYSAAKKGIGMGAAALVGLATGNPMVIGGVIAMGISKALTQTEIVKYLVANDANCVESPVGSGLYNHDLYIIELTKMTECIVVDTITFTNDLGRNYTANATLVSPDIDDEQK